MLYAQGEVISENMQEATRWFCQAAHQDDAEAQFILSTIYANGDGVEQDAVRAYAWASLAERGNDPRAGELVEWLEENLPQYVITEAKRLATEIAGEMAESTPN